MRAHRLSRFETLEKRLALAVTAAVTDGDLVIQGDADGAVQIVAVGTGSYEVRDNGVLIADGTTLTGVTDDIKINIDKTAGADNTVTLDLNGQTVDQVSVKLGNGANTLDITNGTVARLAYRGGSGADTVTLDTTVTDGACIGLGSGDNSLTVNGTVNKLGVRGGAGADTVTLSETSSITKNAFLALGDGANAVTAAGAIGGSLKVDGRDGNDTVTIAATAKITDAFFARLGAGDNVVTHNGIVSGDFTVESKNANDTVTIAETAVIGGTKTLGLGTQVDNGHDCDHGHEHGKSEAGQGGPNVLTGGESHNCGNGGTTTSTTSTTTTSATKSVSSIVATRVGALLRRR